MFKKVVRLSERGIGKVKKVGQKLSWREMMCIGRGSDEIDGLSMPLTYLFCNQAELQMASAR